MAYYVTDDVNNTKEKKQPVEMSNYGTSIYDRGAIKSKQSETGQMIKSSGHAAALTPKGSTATEVKEVVLHQKFWTFPGSLSLTIICWYTDRKQALLTNMLCYCTQARNSFAEGGLPLKLKAAMTFDGDDILLVKRSIALGTDGLKVCPCHRCDS